MVDCVDNCPREAMAMYAADSAGIVDDEEQICRGAFEGNYSAQGELRINLIAESQLLTGQVSVYRASAKAQFSVGDIADQLKQTNQNTLKEIYAATAAQIRALTIERVPGRILCIVDDCVIDRAGNKHRAHAHILLCEVLTNNGLTKGDERLVSIRNKLRLLLGKTKVWPTVGCRSGF
jgi:hypothetical protein